MNDLFDALGFSWDRHALQQAVPTHSIERVTARFLTMLPEYVWDASMLEGNPFTFVEVKTLVDGVTVGGHKLSDELQVRNLITSSRRLYSLVRQREFHLAKDIFCHLHSLVAREEALEWGHFRGEGAEQNYTPDVALGEKGRFTPALTGPQVQRQWEQGFPAVQQIAEPFERAMVFFLFGARSQFFFDGNKRTSRMMMNGILMSNGIDAISVPANRRLEWNQKMVGFYSGGDATEMMRFLMDCHPAAEEILGRNRGMGK